MSLEYDITGLKEEMTNLDEGYAKAKELYVDRDPPLMNVRQLNTLSGKDPTPQKKYIEWMAGKYVSGFKNIRQYDVIADFHRLLAKMPQKDIGQYASPEAVQDAVSSATREESEATERKKAEDVTRELVARGGNVGGTYNYLNGHRLIRDAAGNVMNDAAGHPMVDENIPEYVTREFVQGIYNRMLNQAEGKDWKDFTIDEDVLNEIDPADVVYDNKYVVIVKPLTTESSQKYGRWPKDWGDSNKLGAAWCTSYTKGYNRFISYYQNGGDTFYIVLPKNVSYVPEKKYAKVNLQVGTVQSGEHITGWDFEDHTMDEADVKKILKMWKIPFGGKEKKKKADNE